MNGLSSDIPLCGACRQQIQPRMTPGNPRKWCSERCRIWALRHPGEVRPANPACEWCHRPIVGRQAHARYCQRECYLAAIGRLGADRALSLALIAKTNVPEGG